MGLAVVEDLSWDAPTADIADRLEATLTDNSEDKLTGDVLDWWFEGMSDLSTRAAARKLATEIMHRCRDGVWTCKRIFMKEISVSWAGSNVKVDLVLTDSIFEPEDWSRTFLEGLLRRPKPAWRNAEVIELGIGSGFISITLCKLLDIHSILGLDLNIVACTSAQLNIMINGTDNEGEVAPVGRSGKPLWETIRVRESDLLQYACVNGIRVDTIIGCIPQAMQPEAPDRSLTEILYDLGNYCAVQGLVEDSFGLGLNAAAIDQSHEILREGGSIVLNLAGRPGTNVVKRMFLRRGLEPRTLWRTRIFQAGDTSVDPLAKLEADTKTDFEFFLHRQSLLPVPARTAAKVLAAGGSVWHELRVFEAAPKMGETWRTLVRSLRHIGITEANRDVDLEHVCAEQAQFVIALADTFKRRLYLPLPDAPGSDSFLDKVASYLNRYAVANRPATPENTFSIVFTIGRDLTRRDLFVGPSRVMTYHSLILAQTKRGDCVLVNQVLERMLKPVSEELGVEMIACSDSAQEISEMLELLRPKFVAFAVEDGWSSLNELRTLVSKACELQVPLMIDETAIFDITSRATGGGIIGALSDSLDAAYPTFVIGLEKSTVYPDLNVTIVASLDRKLHENLLSAASGTYARISRFHELYYEGLFDDMTIFRMWDRDDKSMAKSLNEAGPGLIRLDLGTNNGEMPAFLAKALVQSFLDRSAGSSDPEEEESLIRSIVAYLAATRHCSTDLRVSVHHGRWPAIYNTFIALRDLRRRTLKVGVAGPTEGLTGLLQLAGVDFVPLIENHKDMQYKLTVADLDALETDIDVIYMTNPALPTGDAYTRQEISELVQWTEAGGIWLFVDEGHAMIYASTAVDSPLSAETTNHVAVFGGISREFAVGGLRVGWMATGSSLLLKCVDNVRLSPLPNFALRSTRLLLGAAARDAFVAGTELNQFLHDQTRRFEKNLTTVNNAVGHALVHPKKDEPCGLFCVVDIRKLSKKDPATLVRRLATEKLVKLHLMGNSGYVRITLGAWDPDIQEAMLRLKDFLRAEDLEG